MCSVISLLEADYSIHSVLGEFCVIFCGERHDLDFQIREILLRDVEGLCQIRHAGLQRILAGDYQKVLERSQFLDGLVLILALFRCKDYPFIGLLAWNPQYTQELMQELVM